jgi:AAT family amino acid transporter
MKKGCPPNGNCQLPGYPYTSWIAIISLIGVILSMPLVPGQGYGLLAGVVLTLLYVTIYVIKKSLAKKLNKINERNKEGYKEGNFVRTVYNLIPQTHMESSQELTPPDKPNNLEKEEN